MSMTRLLRTLKSKEGQVPGHACESFIKCTTYYSAIALMLNLKEVLFKQQWLVEIYLMSMTRLLRTVEI